MPLGFYDDLIYKKKKLDIIEFKHFDKPTDYILRLINIFRFFIVFKKS